MRQIKLYGNFYDENNIAGVIASAGIVVTMDNPNLYDMVANEMYVDFNPLFCYERYCEYCHSKLTGDVCMSCGANYAQA